MRLLTTCVKCAMDRDSLDPPEALYVELTEDFLIRTRCTKGHEEVFALQQQKFEVLLEMGAMALLDGYYREAVSTFAAAYERFLEFFVRVVCEARGAGGAKFDAAWKLVAAQSERQVGAFVFLCLLEEGEAPDLAKKMTELRNAVVHKGRFPTEAEALEYGKQVYAFIVAFGGTLSRKHEDALQQVVHQTISERLKRAGSQVAATGTLYSPMLFDLAYREPTTDFEAALRELANRRRLRWAGQEPATPAPST